MKRFTAFLLTLVLVLSLSACGCKHEWLAATCETPKTCELCGQTEGEAKGHSIVAATCEEPEHCENCNYEYGEPLGHTWVDATTEAPKSCEICGATEGERIITDERFTTSSTKDLYGTWTVGMAVSGEMMGIADFPGELLIDLILVFHNDGNLDVNVEIDESFDEALVQYTVDLMYEEFAAQGMDQTAADELFAQTYSMSIQQYVEEQMAEVDFESVFNAMFEAVGLGGVYYVADGLLYTGTDWDSELTAENFTLEGDTLTLSSFATELNTDGIFSRVAE